MVCRAKRERPRGSQVPNTPRLGPRTELGEGRPSVWSKQGFPRDQMLVRTRCINSHYGPLRQPTTLDLSRSQTRLGIRGAGGSIPSHGSNQKRVHIPFPMEILIPMQISCLIDWKNFHNWEPSHRSHARSGRPCGYFTFTSCIQRPTASSRKMCHTHFSIRATFMHREARIPRPPWSLGNQISIHFCNTNHVVENFTT